MMWFKGEYQMVEKMGDMDYEGFIERVNRLSKEDVNVLGNLSTEDLKSYLELLTTDKQKSMEIEKFRKNLKQYGVKDDNIDVLVDKFGEYSTDIRENLINLLEGVGVSELKEIVKYL